MATTYHKVTLAELQAITGIANDRGWVGTSTLTPYHWVGAAWELSSIAALGVLPIATAAGTVDAITADYTPDVTLTNLQMVAFVASGANTSTTPTFSPDGGTARTIVKQGGQALVAGDIPGALAVCILEYNLANTRWELLNPAKTIAGGITDTTLSGTPKVFTIYDGATPYYFKAYPTKV